MTMKTLPLAVLWSTIPHLGDARRGLSSPRVRVTYHGHMNITARFMATLVAITLLACCDNSGPVEQDADPVEATVAINPIVNQEWLVGSWGCALRQSLDWMGGSWVFRADGTYESRIGSRGERGYMRIATGTWTLDGDRITVIPTQVTPTREADAVGQAVSLPIEDATERTFVSRWDNASMTMLRQSTPSP